MPLMPDPVSAPSYPMVPGIVYFWSAGVDESPPPNNPNNPPIRGISPNPLFKTVEAIESNVLPPPPELPVAAPAIVPARGTDPKTLSSSVEVVDSEVLAVVVEGGRTLVPASLTEGSASLDAGAALAAGTAMEINCARLIPDAESGAAPGAGCPAGSGFAATVPMFTVELVTLARSSAEPAGSWRASMAGSGRDAWPPDIARNVS